MTYVYILQSVAFPEHYYVGITGELRARLQRHNAGERAEPLPKRGFDEADKGRLAAARIA